MSGMLVAAHHQGGKPVATPEENQDELLKQATGIHQQALVMLRGRE
jgi:hypothetical protein